jgi:transcriptional regulator GlxA family with amidase domain
MMKNLRVGILGFDGLTALDLVGPHEAFGAASDTLRASEASASYKLAIIGVTRRPFHATSGLTITPQFPLDTAPPLDTLIIPGGPGLRVPALNRRVARWIRETEPKTRRVVSVCTGIYALAASGLLDGRRVTTHWYHAADVARRFPGLRVDPNALFVQDGKFYTSAGITAGIDLALELIEEDFGRRTALTVARELVVYLKRPGGQDQYSEPLQFQFQSTDRVGDVAQWMARNLKKDLSRGSRRKGDALGSAFQPPIQSGNRTLGRRVRGELTPRRGPQSTRGEPEQHRGHRCLGGLRERRFVSPRL